MVSTMKIASKSLQVASESCPQLPRQRSSALAVISTRRSEKMATFHGEIMSNHGIEGIQTSDKPRFGEKTLVLSMVKFWYGTIWPKSMAIAFWIINSSGSKCAIHGSNWHRICRSDDLQRWWRGSKLKMEQIKRPRLKPTWNIFL